MAVTDNLAAHGGIEGERPTLVAPRVYALRYQGYETVRMFGRALKLVLTFTIAETGDDFEKPLVRYYNVVRLIGKPQRNGQFKVGFSSSFMREFVKLFGMPGRLDRIPMSRFEGSFIRGRVRTVTTTSQQQPIPAELQYSIIDELTELMK